MINVHHMDLYKKNLHILKDIHVNIPNHKFCALFGPNGAGKTSFMKCLTGFERDCIKQISFDGTLLSKMSNRQKALLIAWQPPYFSLPFNYRVKDLLLLGRYPWHQGRPTRKDWQIIQSYLHDLDVHSFENCSFNELSSGEQKQVLIVRTLVQDTPYIFLDEACAHLDIHISHKILNYLQYLKDAKNKTIVLSIHDLSMGQRYADYKIILNEGRIAKADTSNISVEHMKKIFKVESTYIETKGHSHLISQPLESK